MVRPSALLVDLDDTLLPDRPAALAAMARLLGALERPSDRDPAAVLGSFAATWRRSPFIEDLRGVGLSSWEALWGPLPRRDDLAEWVRDYRIEVWEEHVRSHGASPSTTSRPAPALSRLYAEMRAEETFRGAGAARAVLGRLARRGRIVVVTNGSAALQRHKLERAGLLPFVCDVFVSEEVGAPKSSARFWDRVAQEHNDVGAVIGDSVPHDIEPAVRRGWPAVHLRAGNDRCPCPASQHASRVGDLPEAVDRLVAAAPEHVR